MNRFAELLDRLVLTPSRNGKLTLLIDYFRSVEDPDRGLALAAITGDLSIAAVKPAMLRALVVERMDPVLFGYSYDYVGDLAETVSLVWPQSPDHIPNREPTLGEVVAKLQAASRSDGPKVLARLLDSASISARFAIIKLVTGGLRIGVSARLAKQALAEFGKVDVAEIEELWHGLTPPYAGLFAWLEGKAEKPQRTASALFRPVMLSNPIGDGDLEKLDPADYAAEWKWDGIRVQAVCEDGVRRLYSRTGDDVSGAFPDLADAMHFSAALDGELLVGEPSATGTFSDLQQRLNRKTVTPKMQQQYPAFMRCYDVLQIDGEDLRTLPLRERRLRLEAFVGTLDPSRFDLSPLVAFEDWPALERLRQAPPHPIIEGVMLKRWDSPYLAGRPKGPWFKWKRDPHTVDAVLMYAQRGHGKRSSFYSDYTFGVWSGPEGAEELVPVGKAYFGFTDEELKQIDKYVRDNTVERFGPVRSVRADRTNGLVLEVAFEGLNRSTRHKSGVAMRFPRISRLRWDKPAAEADRIETLQALLDA
ncbi:cisplatin damage response ATP-dependent DNA ligase [Mesorhizobium amorphae]|uniref:DNA ligase (ATP) n=1 Tax=Mesorhizobium amorphae CCNWGS0123 TaxID=1082933 RepID=G6YBQ3_9HYPH|nr:cisplatin damage response ATP-dependent DNA ligase [Mesorhizobium amorphae]ANT49760.1 ATP-dependent DNA ligase [Mesorhizobium amorphae CCNWGS0123]EHH10894.1 ATP-dependent DNA ligase [Mesorhizobium amorphae CCNWGS0123]GLR40112.1 ATP-dependent DNA ligase [Mesorhizobium amorphae]